MKNLLTVLIALFAFASCKKKDDTIYLSQDIKTKFGFKPGSYWIYRDSISGRVDSCWLKECTIRLDDSKSSGPSYEIMVLRMAQKPIDARINDHIIWGMNFYKTLLSCINERKTIDGIERGFNLIWCTYPITKELDILSSKDSVYRLKTFALGSNIFKNVNVLHFDKTGNNVLFLNDSIGYLKMAINTTKYFNRENGALDSFKIKEVWEIQKWNLIK